jgi:hypothetical protein
MGNYLYTQDGRKLDPEDVARATADRGDMLLTTADLPAGSIQPGETFDLERAYRNFRGEIVRRNTAYALRDDRMTKPDAQALLIHIPDVWEPGRVEGWFNDCLFADEVARSEAAPKMYVPGDVRVEITYPALRDVTEAVQVVYVAWKGKLRWLHLASAVAELTMDALSDMDEAAAAGMKAGAFYLWVFATPFPVANNPVPGDLRGGFIPTSALRGSLADLQEARPRWL